MLILRSGNTTGWIAAVASAVVAGTVVAWATAWLLASISHAATAVLASFVSTCLLAAIILGDLRRAVCQFEPMGSSDNADELQGGLCRLLLQPLRDALQKSRREAAEVAGEKAELEARLQLRQNDLHRLESALEVLLQPVLITDSANRPKFCNAAARKVFGRDNRQRTTPQEADLACLPALKALLEETRRRNAATNERKCELEVEVDGEAMAYEVRAIGILDADEYFAGIAAVFEDIRDKRQEQARHAEFVSSVCHELKTPMTGIKSFVEMLSDGEITEPEEQQEIYGFIETQVDRLTRLVHNMLNLTRIQSGVIQVQREDCELNGILRAALNVAQPMAEEKQIRVVCELSELYLAVHADTDLFGQAITNLLSNAIKYTPEGGEVGLRSRMDEDRAVIEVRDTGVGIPKDSLARIFDRFYRVPENNHAAVGTGLGLTLVQYIVTELHNGQISVESEVGEGTCFRVTIPRGHRNAVPKKKEVCSSS